MATSPLALNKRGEGAYRGQKWVFKSLHCTSWTSPGVIYDIDFQGRTRKLGVSLKESLQ